MPIADFIKIRISADIRPAETNQVISPPIIDIIITQAKASCGANIRKLPDFLNIFSGNGSIKTFVRRQPK